MTTAEIKNIANQLDVCESILLQWVARENAARYRQCSGRTLNDLVERGLVQVGENSDTNRKDALVWLTPLGKQVVARVKEEAA